MASLSPYAITLGSTDYPVKYAGLLSYVEPYLTNLESFTFSAGNVSLAGNFTLGAASDLTLDKGTANGVLYLNGSKVVTTGSALVFDGSNLGLGVTPSAWGSTWKAQQFSAWGAVAVETSSTGELSVSNNTYASAVSTFRYIGSFPATNYRQANGAHAWLTAPSGTAGNAISFTQAMTLDASGNLGVGTTSPTSGFRLDVQATTARQRIESTTGTNEVHQRFVNTGGTFYAGLDNSTGGGFGAAYGAVLWHTGNYPMVFATNNTERARITSGGNLLVGFQSNASGDTNTPLQIDANATGSTLYTARFSNTSTSTSAYNVVRWIQGASGSATGYVGTGGSAVGNAAFANNFVVGTQTSNALVFNTADSERARITSGGDLLVGTTTGLGRKIVVGGTTTTARVVPATDNVGSVGDISYRWEAIYAVNGTIQTSDAREKTAIQDSDLGLNFIAALRPVHYKWNSNYADQRTHYGLIAQEVKAALPGDVDFGGLVEEENDGRKSLAYNEFIAPLIKAIQEQQAIIEDLRARVAALEAQP